MKFGLDSFKVVVQMGSQKSKNGTLPFSGSNQVAREGIRGYLDNVSNGISPNFELDEKIIQKLPKEFKEQAFVPIVQNYMDQFNEPENQSYYFNAYPEEAINQLSKKLQVALFNMIKELTTNAYKHAKANQVMIQLNYIPEESSLSLMYEDDGIGFLPNNSEGIGLKNLKSRIDELQGSLSIDSNPGKGTVISIHIPIKEAVIKNNENSL